MNNFQLEAEKVFFMPNKYLPELLQKELTLIRTYKIDQKWLKSWETDTGRKVRIRIRKSEQFLPPVRRPIYTYTTKIDAEEGIMELNAPIEPWEYKALGGMYGGEIVSKTRVVAQDNESGLYYTFDLFENDPMARVEIEFGEKGKLDGWVMPEWLSSKAVGEGATK